MKVLYKDRDYSELLEEEQKEKEKLEKEQKETPGIFKPQIYHLYPKAVRHYLSLFPNNFLDPMNLKDEDSLKEQCDSFSDLLDGKIIESDIKHFIQDNEYYHIPASIFDGYSFGHHGAYLFKEFHLGTDYIADYVLVGDSSGGHQFIFVEFENPYDNITIKDGDFGATIRKGTNQIHDWKSFIESDYSTLATEFKKYTNKSLPDEFYKLDTSRIHYVVVAGRRKDYNKKTYRLRRDLEKNESIKLLHYDNLLDLSRKTIGNNTY